MGNNQSYPTFNHREEVLDISNKKYDKIPYKIPNHNCIKSLMCDQTMIQELPHDLKQVKSVSLVNNSYSSLPQKIQAALLTYPELKYIDLSENEFTSAPEFFLKLTTVKKISMNKNQLTSFISPPNLTLISLSQNRLTSIPEFPSGIRIISLDFNLLREFNLKADSLLRLSINLNHLETFKPNIYPQLEVLNLTMNRLSILPNLAETTPVLKTLDIS